MKRNKIYNNIEESQYQINISNFIFYFSSVFYMSKFQEEKESFEKKINNKFKALYDFEVDFKLYADFILYNKIEKRGFYIRNINTNEVITWLNLVKFAGVIKTKTN